MMIGERRILRQPPTSLGDVLQGNHPDLRVSHEKLDGNRRVALATHVAQREAFTPICLNLADSIQSMETKDILEVMAGFKTKPGLQKFMQKPSYYNVLASGLLRYKYRERGARHVLDRYIELNKLFSASQLTEPQSREMYQLGLYFQFNTGDTLTKYTTLLAKGKGTPLNHRETEKLQGYEHQLIETIDHEDKIDDIDKRLLVWGDSSEVDGLIDLYTLMAQNAKLTKADGWWTNKKYENFLWALTEADANHFAANAIIVPVGQYGPELGVKLIVAGRTLVKLADRFSFQDAVDIQNAYPDFIAHRTTRGRDEPYHRSPNPPMTTLQEGLVSVVNAVTLLTASKVKGHENADELLAFVINSGYANLLAHMIFSGFLQPTLFSGRYIKDLLVVNHDGEVKFNFGFEYTMRSGKKQKIMTHETPSTDNEQLTDYGCPLAERYPGEKQSGIESLSRALLHIYKTLPI